MELCVAEKRRPGSRVAMQWWEKDRLDLEGIRKSSGEAEQMEWGEEIDGKETDIRTSTPSLIVH